MPCPHYSTGMSALYLDYSLGALEVGVLISVALWGVTSVQVYLYYSQPTQKDPLRIRLLVPFIWIVECVHTISCCAYLYRLTVTYYGIPAVLLEDSWELEVSAFFDGLVGALVQIFFAHRIHALSGKWTITIISWIGSLLGFAGTTAIMVLSLSMTITEFNTEYRWLTTLSLSVLLFVDVINTSSLCFYLRIGRTGFSSTDDMLNKLFVWTLETGLLTSLAAVLMLIFSLTLSSTTLWISISIFYAKLYSNSLLASLNGRSTLRTVVQSKSEMWSGGRRSSAVVQFASSQVTSQMSHHPRPSLDVDIPKPGLVDPFGVKFEFNPPKRNSDSRVSSTQKISSLGEV